MAYQSHLWCRGCGAMTQGDKPRDSKRPVQLGAGMTVPGDGAGDSAGIKAFPSPTALARMPAPILAIVPATLRARSVHSFAEGLRVEALGALEGALEVALVLFAAHAEIGEVVKIPAEHFVAILAIGAGVEDMVVPHGVHDFVRHDGVARRGEFFAQR